MQILFLNKWYPNLDNPNSAIFIRKHAKAVSLFANVISFHISPSKKINKLFKIHKFLDENIDTIIIYYKKTIPVFDIFFYLISILIGIFILSKNYKKIDLIQVNITASFMLFIALYFKFFKNVKFIILEHSSFYLRIINKVDKLDIIQKTLLLFIRFFSLFSEGIICVSESLKNAMQKIGFKNKFYIIPNVVFEENENIKINNYIESNIGSEFQIKVISVSSLIDKTKNISNLLKGFKIFLNTYKEEFKDNEIILDIYGDGKDREKLIKLANELDLLNKNVFFKGDIDNKKLKELMPSYDFFVMFSKLETFSVATLEAMLCGLPVIATKSGGPEEYLRPEYGILIDKNNINQLVNAFYFMCKNYQNFDKKRISDFVKENYSYRNISYKFKKLYENILINK
ncbi:MAG: glycosyltransferase [bacterium]|nr:glycosyltransferase [bacterium]